MADKKISELGTAAAVYDADDFALVQDGDTKQVNASAVKAYIGDAPTIVGGTVDGAPIGSDTASTGAFTTLSSSSTTTLNGTTIPASKTLVVTTDIGSSVQAYSSNLDEYAAVNPTTAGLALLDDTDASAQRTTLGLGNSSTLNVGTTTGTVAAGDHTHTGVYEPADATILKDADIGSSIQAYDADLSAIAALSGTSGLLKKTAADTWTLDTSAYSTTVGTVTSVSGTGTVNGLTLTGTVTSSGSLTLGGTLDLSSPPAIGSTTPAAGAFTTLSSTGNTTLGDASADTLTINGTAVSIPNNLNFDSNTLFIDAANNAVGIGTTTIGNGGATSPSRLTLRKTAQSTVSDGSYIHIGATEAGVGTYQLITFGYNTGSLANSPAFIGYTNTNLSGNTFGDLIFGTRNVGTDTPATERMRIDSSGNVGIGTSSPAAKLDVLSDTNGGQATIQGSANNVSIVLQNNQTASYAWRFYTGGTSGVLATNKFAICDNAATPRLVIDTSGNVGIGTTSPNSVGLHIQKASANTGIRLERTTDVAASSTMYVNANGDLYLATLSNDSIVFGTNNSDRAMIDSAGNLLVGGTSPLFATKLSVYGAIAAQSTYGPMFVSNENNGDNVGRSSFNFNRNGTNVGQIVTTNTTCSFNSVSDARLKTNIVDSASAIQSIKDIKVRAFDWISSGIHQDYGYIAQELKEIAPEAVHCPEDDSQMMSVDFGKLTPRIIKAIQELHAEIELLKAKVN